MPISSGIRGARHMYTGNLARVGDTVTVISKEEIRELMDENPANHAIHYGEHYLFVNDLFISSFCGNSFLVDAYDENDGTVRVKDSAHAWWIFPNMYYIE